MERGNEEEEVEGRGVRREGAQETGERLASRGVYLFKGKIRGRDLRGESCHMSSERRTRRRWRRRRGLR